jgi:hypothetical protein
MVEVVASFNDKSDVKKVQQNGIHIAGQKYFVIKADDESIYGKQVCLIPFHTLPASPSAAVHTRDTEGGRS